MRDLCVTCLLVFLISLFAHSAAQAHSPKLISIQGRLTNSSGTPLAGTYSVQLSIWNEASGGVALYQETQSITTDANGLFTTNFGSQGEMQPSVANDTTIYLGIKVGADPEMMPRTRLTAVPFAYRVQSIAGAAGGSINGTAYIEQNLVVNGLTTLYGGQYVQDGNGGNALYSIGSGIVGVNNVGVRGDAFNSTTLNAGVYAEAEDANGYANSAAIYGVAHNNGGGAIWAGYFDGWLHATGNISAGSKSFKIDDPTDPANKTLMHGCVESDEYKNVYDGVVSTDASGNATIVLPNWFEALNRDFRYQLTCIGEFTQAIVSSEVANNQFSIRTDKPGVKVSWQVTGVRKDPYAAAHPLEVQKAKPEQLRGKYLHPLEYGLDEQAGVDYTTRQIAKEQATQTVREARDVEANKE